jgi:hypothetical protein
MSNKETGGPVFPFNKRPEQAFPSTFKSLDGKEQIHAWGMTLRDYFAAKVLPQCLQVCGTKTTAAEEAYRMADAMIAAREKS